MIFKYKKKTINKEDMSKTKRALGRMKVRTIIKKNNIIFILSHIAYRKNQFICPVPWTHEELILKWDRETIMREKIQKKINQTFVTCFLYGAK